MRKIPLLPITLAAIIASVTTFVSMRQSYEKKIDELEQELQTLKQEYVAEIDPSPSIMEVQMGVPCSNGDASEVYFSDAGISLTIPCGINISRSPESNRRGTFAAYDFIYQEQHGTPYLAEIQFFSRESISAFQAFCSTVEVPCFFGQRFSVRDYDELKAAYEGISDWKERHMFVFNDHNMLVKSMPCEGDTCVIREYVWFDGDTMISTWVMMEDLEQQEAADEVFRDVILDIK